MSISGHFCPAYGYDITYYSDNDKTLISGSVEKSKPEVYGLYKNYYLEGIFANISMEPNGNLIIGNKVKNLRNQVGLTQQELAAALSISYSSMRQILSGATKLTEQLSKHIEYVLNKRKQQTLVYTVDLPEGTVRSWIPGFESLSAEEQQQTLHAICANVLRELIAKGTERLTPEELAALKELHGLPTTATYSKALDPYA